MAITNEFQDPTNLTEAVKAKWKPILEHKDCDPITDPYKRNVTAILLENQEQAMLAEAAPVNNIGGSALGSDGANAVKTWDPVLISLVRRSMPNLIAYDICGVQPMTGPTGLIFAMKAKFENQSGTEAWPFNIDDNFSGGLSSGYVAASEDDFLKSPGTANGQTAGGTLAGYDAGGHGLSTAYGEAMGDGTNPFPGMAFEISRTSVVAKTRALKAEYTTELAQDLKAIHGLDAETELANILSGQILAEINREVLSSVYRTAKLGCQQTDLSGKGAGTTIGAGGLGGFYDLVADSDGRWSAEKFRGLLFQIERECNQIAKDTRRGKGNLVICSSDVASALAMGGFLQLSGGDAGNLNVDDAGNLLAGTIGGGRIKVYVDPYATFDFAAVGYRGSSAYDAGMFYCPYVPLQMVRAVGENTFQPKIGFKTRYGLVNNPYVETATAGARDLSNVASNRVNQYYRVFRIANLHGTSA
jgi:hypothetical protein